MEIYPLLLDKLMVLSKGWRKRQPFTVPAAQLREAFHRRLLGCWEIF